VLRATLKSLFARKVRLGLTALSIVLGVGFVAGTLVLTDTMNKAFNDLFKQVEVGTDVVVRGVSAFTPDQSGPGGGGVNQARSPIPADLLKTVEQVPGVAAAHGDVTGTIVVVDPVTGKSVGGVGPPTLAANWSGGGALELRQGSPPTGPDQVVIDAGTAAKHQLRLGQRITIIAHGSPATFTLTGIAGFGSADNLAGATLALFDTPTAQKLLGREGEFDQISVRAVHGVSPGELRTRIAGVLPPRVEAVTATAVADEQAKTLQDALGFFRTALLVFAFIALFVGAFIIFNTFTIIVTQRSRELGLLRALGASRRQVLTSVVLEAIITGFVAAAVGIVAGVGIALGLKLLLRAFGIDLPSTSLQLEGRTVIVGLLIGVVVTLVASVVPALRASRVSPIEAMRDTPDAGRRAGLGWRRVVPGVLVTSLGVALLLFGLFGNASSAASLVGLGAALTFVGVAIVSPLIARPLAGVIGLPIRRLGIQGRLGRENAMRNPRRTASTASALMIGLGLVSMVSILSASLTASITDTLQRTLKADYVLTSSSFAPFSPAVAAKVRQVSGVHTVSEFRQGGFRVNGNDTELVAVDPATVEDVTELKLSPGAQEALQEGKVVVYTKTATDDGLKAGDPLAAAFATTGSAPLVVGGTFGENSLVNVNYLVSLDTYAKYFPEQLDAFVMVKAAPGSDLSAMQGSLETAVKPFADVEVQNQAAYRKSQAGLVNQILGLVTALLAMAILIALFGIANTLGLSILERRREIGLLRAVGMGRRQVKRMIRWESVIIAVLGALMGIAIGAFFGWSLQRSLVPQGVNVLVFPVGQLAFYVVFAGLAGVLAAIWPARRAAKLNVLDAISYE
jgi:putative ABC transport system permease protein